VTLNELFNDEDEDEDTEDDDADEDAEDDDADEDEDEERERLFQQIFQRPQPQQEQKVQEMTEEKKEEKFKEQLKKLQNLRKEQKEKLKNMLEEKNQELKEGEILDEKKEFEERKEKYKDDPNSAYEIKLSEKAKDVLMNDNVIISDFIEENKNDGAVILNVIEERYGGVKLTTITLSTKYAINKRSALDQMNIHTKENIIVYPCKEANSTWGQNNVIGKRPLYNFGRLIEHNILVDKTEVDKIIKMDKKNVFINITKPSKIDTFPAVVSHRIFNHGPNPERDLLVSGLHCNAVETGAIKLFVSEVKEVEVEAVKKGGKKKVTIKKKKGGVKRKKETKRKVLSSKMTKRVKKCSGRRSRVNKGKGKGKCVNKSKV
jgi:hypothetical protein